MIGRFFKRLLGQRDQHQDDVEAAVPTDQAVNGARNVIQDSSKNFYRFRSSDALVGERAELLNQEIYFADLRQLNDPMEGSKDVFWRGDSILWSNLIKHYLLCLELAITQATFLGKDSEIKLEKLVFNTTLGLPTQTSRDIHGEVCAEFFKNSDVAALPVLLGQRNDPIRRDELFFYLTAIQVDAFLCVISCLQRHNLFPPLQLPSNDTVPSTLPLALQFIRALNRQDPDQREVEIAQRVFQLTSQVRYRTHIAIRRDETKAENVWWNSLMFSFPESYILALDSLLFTEWYTACFVTDPHQAAMWGNYGDGHRGVCLKFRASRNQGDQPSLNLRRITGWGSGPKGRSVHYDYVPHEFVPVDYEDRFPEVVF